MRRRMLAATSPAVCAALSLRAAEPIRPLEPAVVKNPQMVDPGEKLFFNPRLSRSGLISCNSCHNLAAGGADDFAVFEQTLVTPEGRFDKRLKGDKKALTDTEAGGNGLRKMGLVKPYTTTKTSTGEHGRARAYTRSAGRAGTACALRRRRRATSSSPIRPCTTGRPKRLNSHHHPGRRAARPALYGRRSQKARGLPQAPDGRSTANRLPDPAALGPRDAAL